MVTSPVLSSIKVEPPLTLCPAGMYFLNSGFGSPSRELGADNERSPKAASLEEGMFPLFGNEL
jgi:hypothetical protein